MAKINKNSRRQRLICLRVGASAVFPLTMRAGISSQLAEIQATTGQRYTSETIKDKCKVTRIS